MTPNFVLLRYVLNHLEHHPDRWDQRYWFQPRPGCGTTHCFAGWTVILAGYTLIGDTVAVSTIPADIRTQIHPADLHTYGGLRVHVAPLAAALLGLANTDFDDTSATENRTAEHLFYGGNTLASISDIISELASEYAPAGTR